MGRPREWYEMSYEQQREWERNEREHEDRLRREQDERDEERRSYEAREDYAILSEDYDSTLEALKRANAFIQSKGLWKEFEAFEYSPTEGQCV